MIARMGQLVVGMLSALVLSVLPVQAVERICSVYMESPSALQMQVQQASQVFEAPGADHCRAEGAAVAGTAAASNDTG